MVLTSMLWIQRKCLGFPDQREQSMRFFSMHKISRVLSVVIVCSLSGFLRAQDTVELTTGATARGKVRSYAGSSVVIEVKIGNRTIQRRYPKSRVKVLTINGRRIDMNSKTPARTTTAGQGRTERSREEVLAEIDRLGKTPPDWYESTPLNYPKTLDLAWPMPAPRAGTVRRMSASFYGIASTPIPGSGARACDSCITS